MRLAIFLLTTLLGATSLPLQQDSLISLRTTQSQPSAGGNIVQYKQLILEEWSSINPSQPLQTWTPNCTLPDISTETLTEGLLRSSYPYGDGIWFLCRAVPVNTSFTTLVAPLQIMNLQENGELIQWATDSISYPGGTSTNSVLSYTDVSQGTYTFYILGGAVLAGPGTPPRPTQPRIRIDTGPGTPPETQGQLATLAQNVNAIGITIMTNTLYMPAQVPNGTSGSIFSIYQVGTENILPSTTRNPLSIAITNEPLMLSSWTFPFVDVVWYTGFNRLPYLARTNYSDPNPQTQTLLSFVFPESGSFGSLGGPRWRVNTARFEGNYYTTGETIYINNQTHIYKNTVLGILTGIPFQYAIKAPPSWKFLDIHARFVMLPTPSATPTASASATATMTPTSSASSTSTPSTSSTPTSTSSSSPKPTPSATSSASASVSASASASASASYSFIPQLTTTPSESPTPSNGTIPVPPDGNANAGPGISAGATAGISLGVIAFVAAAGLFAVVKIPVLKKYYITKFGSRIKQPPKGRRPVTKNPQTTIEISQNPYHLTMVRVAQLKAMQETHAQNKKTDRVKKVFQPIVTNEKGASV